MRQSDLRFQQQSTVTDALPITLSVRAGDPDAGRSEATEFRCPGCLPSGHVGERRPWPGKPQKFHFSQIALRRLVARLSRGLGTVADLRATLPRTPTFRSTHRHIAIQNRRSTYVSEPEAARFSYPYIWSPPKPSTLHNNPVYAAKPAEPAVGAVTDDQDQRTNSHGYFRNSATHLL